MNNIYYTKPSITKLEIDKALDAATTGWGSKCYEYIHKFENLFKDFTGAKHCIATSSGTGALHMGLSALGIGPGDEVILADINWIASVAPVVHLGAKPVFADILRDTWCIDPSKLEAAITPRTKAIIAVHLYGNLCEMDEILTIAQKHDLIVIEDAAEAIGSVYKGKHAGTIGEFGTFSFHGTKTLTTGEGGMFITNSSDLCEQVQILNNHGRSPKTTKQFWAEVVGFKYKISNIQAALGCAQMERIDELINRKREIFFKYYELLKGYDFLKMNPIPEDAGTQYGYWMPTLIFNESIDFDREKLLEEFKENKIDGRVFFYPLSSLPMFEERRENNNTYSLFDRGINLPSYHELTDDDIKRVVQCLLDFVNK